MRDTTPLHVIWRRRWIIIVVFLVFAGGTAIASRLLPKVYITHSTLLIAQRAENQTFDSVQASQTVARSYADIIDSPNIARDVSTRLGGDPGYRSVLDATSFEPVPETQLLKINVEDRNPSVAKRIADAYADVFIAYAAANLQQTTKANVSLADAAPRPRQPARPKPTLYTLLAAILGLGLGLGLAFLRDRLDRRLRTPEDVEAQFDTPILTRVPVRGRSRVAATAFEEAYRLLRTNLQFAGVEGGVQSIAVVSGSDGEGKTTCVANLARSSSEIGLRVTVVEGDLRRPALQKVLLPEEDQPLWPGLSNYLIRAVSLDEALHRTDDENISIIPAGPLPPSPWALLESPRGRGLVPELRSRADTDLIVVDSPPFGVGADAAVITDWVDGVVVVVDLGKATDRTLREVLRQLEAAQAPVIGLVINRDRTARSSSYEYYLSAGVAELDRPVSPLDRERESERVIR
jgi:capsular exopolysaccharide synthesis family protein